MKRKLTVNEAFEKLINKPNWNKLVGLKSNHASALKGQYLRTKSISMDKMELYLEKAGCTIPKKIVELPKGW